MPACNKIPDTFLTTMKGAEKESGSLLRKSTHENRFCPRGLQEVPGSLKGPLVATP